MMNSAELYALIEVGDVSEVLVIVPNYYTCFTCQREMLSASDLIYPTFCSRDCKNKWLMKQVKKRILSGAILNNETTKFTIGGKTW